MSMKSHQHSSTISHGTPRLPMNAANTRFSFISFFTNNGSNQKRQKRNKLAKVRSNSKSSDQDIASTSNLPSIISPKSHTSIATVDRIIVNTEGEQLRECPLCFEDQPLDNFPQLMSCLHQSCEMCLRQYLKIEIGESRVNISCPECSEKIHPADIQRLLKNDALMIKYEEFMLRRVLVADPDARWCPAPDCGYAVIAWGCAGCPMLKCEKPGCETLFCYHCKQEWHPNQTCDAARRDRVPALHISFSDNPVNSIEQYKPCPRCRTMINKMDDGSCNHMTCAICGVQFCWLCQKEASDLHYLSPSGCTFWGKKPWSKKKKILWQLGTLVGAPIGIALIAGLCVPVFVIGLPIWAGRKLYQKFQKLSVHKRNCVVAAGVIGTFIVSPLVAAVAIAIGVPVMLTYVYGVVPISLCRGGTCGVKTNNGSFSFDFSSGQGDQARNANTFQVANPSIGPSIGEASLGAVCGGLSASGSHVDGIGLSDDQSDRESASIRNLAGHSLTGSIYEPEATLHKKLEVHADIAIHSEVGRKGSIDRASVHTVDTRSMGDNRSHVSFNVDNASLKALAGSITAGKDKDGQSICDMETRGKSCIRADTGSPVSGRSVSFATRNEIASSSRTSCKRKKLRDRANLEKSDKISLKSVDTISNSSNDQPAPRKTEVVNTPDTPQPLLPEVDTDKPVFVTVVIKKTDIANNGGLSEGATTLCNILEDHDLDSVNCKVKRKRRRSCEIAQQSGMSR